MLLLMLWEHGDKEVGPTTHAVANEVKLLRLSLSALANVSGFTHVTNLETDCGCKLVHI